MILCNQLSDIYKGKIVQPELYGGLALADALWPVKRKRERFYLY